ncbi:MAG TPA: DUF374 domain-containing protein [Candidatus Binataceae bacterium]
MRLWMWTWRKDGPSEEQWRSFMSSRVVFATCHGMFLHCIAFSDLPARYGHPLTVMVSPSLGGTVLGMILQRFGMTVIQGKPGRRGAAAAIRLVRSIKAGHAGVVAVDGSRGPCFVVKPGVLWVARQAKAKVLVTTTSANRGISFPTWDRAHLPMPFSHVKFRLEQLSPVAYQDEEIGTKELQRALLESARRLQSPVLPPNLRVAQASQL